MIDRALSELVKKRLRARPGMCWRNAFRALGLGLTELEGAIYCEGSALTGGEVSFPVQHAWLELPDGRVVDPTLPQATHHTRAAAYDAKQLARAMQQPGGSWPVTDEATMDEAHTSLSMRAFRERL